MNSLIEIKNSPLHGKGVFAKKDISKGEVIVKSHMVEIHINENLPEELATLQFPWTKEFDAICLSGAGSFFNHSEKANAKVSHQDFENKIQEFSSKEPIVKGEEITIFYNDEFEVFINNLIK
jgi:SET domain-containing protein